MNQKTLDTTRRRAERYWYEDGIWEIGFGLINLVLAAYFQLTGWLQTLEGYNLAIVGLQLAVMLGIFWMTGYLVRFLKERITYPRTGYVAYRRGPLKARVRRILLIGLLSAGIAATLTIISASSAIRSTTPLISGVIMAGLVVYLGIRYSLLRMFVLAVVMLALSVVMAFLPVAVEQSQVVFFGGYGLLFLVSGLAALAAYLRRTAPQDGTLDYESPANIERDGRDE